MFSHEIAKAHIANLHADARRHARAKVAQEQAANTTRRFALFAHK